MHTYALSRSLRPIWAPTPYLGAYALSGRLFWQVFQDIADEVRTVHALRFPFKIQDVATHFGDIQDELRSQYSVSYRPADFTADGHFRSIAITAADNKKYRVRARRGYFSPANQ